MKNIIKNNKWESARCQPGAFLHASNVID
ncbi:hypothetical protein MUS_1691 [Bacillus velezensis YAU B9601-Y2]|uniref:Uncharacterized protein n=1 Tax=Bacillus amyloliquefaciens (strain Y2) TaxID=1155777 RepID=I2C4W7_BACAY|nr:hypothetical protein MUS_1691 [Bacillus velezensis YAU B9601-Y2]